MSPLKGTGAFRYVTDIMRLKTADDSEFLLSKGHIIGHDPAGEELSFYLPFPELWIKTLGSWVSEYDNRSKSFIKRCLGPNGTEINYMLEYNKENAKKLFDSIANDLLNFIEKQETSGDVRMVEKDVTCQKTFE